jgi:hypothetical protein
MCSVHMGCYVGAQLKSLAKRLNIGTLFSIWEKAEWSKFELVCTKNP